MLKARTNKEGIVKRPEFFKTTDPQERSRPPLNLAPLKSVFYILLIGILIYAVFFSSIFKVKNVEIQNVKSVEISDYLKRTLIGKNILLLRTGAYLDKLTEQFPVLQEAEIVRGLPSTIKISISERRQVLIWCSDKCYEIDSNGYAYQAIERPLDRVAVIDKMGTPFKIGEKVVAKEFINFFISTLDSIEANGLKVSEAEVGETTFKVDFKTTEGWKIILDPTESLKNQMSALKQVLEKNRADIKEYVDLRVEGLAYIK